MSTSPFLERCDILSITTLKILALIAMTFDHIGEYIPGTPIFFHWIGRISAPVFFFCMAWGFYYTKDKKKYLFRMYLFGIGMAFINLLINKLSINAYVNIRNNIFITLLVSCIIIYIIDLLVYDNEKGRKCLFLFLIAQFFSTVIIIILVDYVTINPFPIEFYAALFVNVFFNEGGIPFVILGVLFYYTKNNRRNLILSYSIFCILYSVLYFTNIIARILTRLETLLPSDIFVLIQTIPSILGINTLPIYHIRFYTLTSYHWMIILALPIILFYNGKKGSGYKYLFYLYYPIHIYILYFIGNIKF